MGAKNLDLWQFLIVYSLLLIVLVIMKYLKIGQTRLLLISSVRMTVQLIVAGIVLQLIFEHPHPAFTIAYLAVIVAFAIHRMLKGCKGYPLKFKLACSLSLAVFGVLLLFFFVGCIVGQNIFNPQYTITLSGMVIGNAMTGLNLALKTFSDDLVNKRQTLTGLLNLGAHPHIILKPLINNALETAILPTLNSMLGMGIIFLPGMMTGQILSGTMPTTAILYQIAIMIVICTSALLVSFCGLYFGHKTLYNKRLQLILPDN